MRDDLRKSGRRAAVGHSDAHDLTSRVSELVDLPERRGGIACVGGRHGLHDDRVVAANFYITDMQDACLAAWCKQHCLNSCNPCGSASAITHPGSTSVVSWLGRAVLAKECLAANETANIGEANHKHQSDQQDQSGQVNEPFLFRRDPAPASQHFDEHKEEPPAIECWDR